MATGPRGRPLAARMAFLALMVYVVLDFANPLMPGAVCFNPADSVDGVNRARASVVGPIVTARPVADAPPAPGVAPRIVVRTATPGVVLDIPIVPRARTAPGRSASPSPDDH